MAWAVRQRRRRKRKPTRVKFQSTGASFSSDDDDGRRIWNYVLPTFAVRNDGPSALYELEAGAEDPRGTGARIMHPTRVQRLAGEGTGHRFGGSELFGIPPEWLAGYNGQEPQNQVAYFVAVTDEDGRRWEATCRADPGDDWVPLTFSRA